MVFSELPALPALVLTARDSSMVGVAVPVMSMYLKLYPKAVTGRWYKCVDLRKRV
jgi:hypothetical protein